MTLEKDLGVSAEKRGETQMSEVEIRKLEELRAKGAQGEWQLIDGEAVVTDFRIEGDKRVANWIAEIDHLNQDDYEYGPDWDGSDSALANGQLIVAAVNALPDIIAHCRNLEAQVEEAEGERDEARETNRRLNNRCQVAEKAANEKVRTHPTPATLGRGLANYAAATYRRERDEAEEFISSLEWQMQEPLLEWAMRVRDGLEKRKAAQEGEHPDELLGAAREEL